MQRFELRRHVSRRLALGRRLGSASKSDTLRLSVLLHSKDGHALDQSAAAVSDPRSIEYGRFRTAEEVRRFVAPGYQDLDAVIAWLHDAGLTTEDPTGARTVIRAHGDAETISRALETPIGRYRIDGATRVAIEQNPTIPASLAAIVRGIAGLNDLPTAQRRPPRPGSRKTRVPKALLGPGGGYTPETIRKAYGIPSSGGAGERVGILEFGGGFLHEDFSAFSQEYGLHDGLISEVSVSGAQNRFRGERAEGADAEVALDMDWVRATAPDAAISLYWVPNVDGGWVDFLAALLDAPANTRPSIVSISWGMPEDGYSTSRRYDQTRQLFLSCSLLGITFVCAAGDWGSADEDSDRSAFDGERHVDFPSVMPDVTAIGGTQLTPSPKGFTESVWNEGRSGASGGGFSRFVRIPEWQKGVLAGRREATGRGIPDVAAVASGNPGLSIHVRGRFAAYGGTSVAAPIWAGVLAHVDAARAAAGKPRLGAANAALYAAAKGAGSPFRDVTKGENGYAGVPGFSAGKGWDPVSGLGSPDVKKLMKKLA